MNKVFFVLLFLLFGLVGSAQTGWVSIVNRDGKITHKECKDVSVNPTRVLFIIDDSTYQLFYSAGIGHDGKTLWVDSSNNKLITCVEQEDGTVIFHKSSKKTFYYKPTTIK